MVPLQTSKFVAPSKEYNSDIKVNSHGWPDVEHAYDKPNGVTREVIIGDSFVENFQLPLESRFFRQLQNKIGDKHEVIALGRGNTGTAQQYLILKNYGLKYDPDVVIHMFFEGNDVKNNSKILQNDPFLPYFTIDESGKLKQQEHAKKSSRKMARLKDFLLNFRTVKLFLSVKQQVIERKENNNHDYPTDYHVYDKSYSTEFEDAWRVTKKLISETKAEAEKSGAKYILVAIPASEQVDTKKQIEIFKMYPKMNPNSIDFDKPEKILVEFCKENSIECHFMNSNFSEYLKGNMNGELYFSKDGHWNQNGANMTSEFLYKVLFDQEIVPQN